MSRLPTGFDDRIHRVKWGAVSLQALSTRSGEALERLVQLYDAWGKPAPAAEWKQKLAAFQQANQAAEKKGAQP